MSFRRKTQKPIIMTLKEFKDQKNPQTIQEKMDVEWRWRQAERICNTLGISYKYIVYSEEEDKLYIHAPLE